MALRRNEYKLVHITTAPQSLYYFLDGQVRYMRQQGYEVHGISSPGILLERFGKREGARTHAIKMPRAISPLRDLVSVWQLYLLFRKIKPDIVHSHTPKGGLLGMIAAFLYRAPVRIYHIHGLPHMTANGLKRFILQLSEKISCYLSHQVYCVSKSLSDQVIKEIFFKLSKVKVLHNGSINGVDATHHYNPARYDGGGVRDILGIPNNARVVGFVGRLVRDKGIVELVESWKCLREKYCDLYLLLVGPFEKKDAIPQAVKNKLYSDDRVLIIGPVDDPAPYYSAMDVLAFPTHREGFGLVAVEASAMQIPVVSNCIPGCVDSVINGRTGTLIPKINSFFLTKALSDYLENSEMRQAHGEAGRKWVLEHFKPTEIWKTLYADYCEMANKFLCR